MSHFKETYFELSHLLSFPIFYAQQTVYGDLEDELANINKNGYPGSFIFDAVQTQSNVITEKELLNRLNSPEIQKSLIKRALNYATSKLSEEDMESYTSKNHLSRNLLNNYCSYGWIRWLSFMNCGGNESITSEEDAEEFDKLEIINQGTEMCFKKKISEDSCKLSIK